MPRSKFGSQPLGRAPFLDRVHQKDLILSHLAVAKHDPQYLRVFALVGYGGIGKTRLLNELYGQIPHESEPIHRFWVPLAAEESSTEIGPLLSFREQAHMDCILFDTATLVYWTAMGQPLHRDQQTRLRNSLALQSVQVAGGLVGIPLPAPFALGVYQSIRHRLVRKWHYSKADFEEIDDLRGEPRALLERLPHYLGLDLRRRLDSREQPVVAFFDGYDRQRATTREAQAPWLRELIASIGAGIYLISTREPLHWDSDWDNVLDHVGIDSLPDREARQLIWTHLGTIPRGAEEHIVSVSRRIPFFIEAMATAYAVQVDECPDAEINLPDTPEDAVRHLLDHLDPPERTIATAVATVQWFDLRLFRYLAQALSLAVGSLAFDEFVNWFFVERVEGDLFKVHDLLAELVRGSPNQVLVKRSALETCGQYIFGRCHGDGSHELESLLPIFHGVLAGWLGMTEVPVSAIETLMDVGYTLYDAGYWNELADPEVALQSRDHPVAVVTGFFNALAVRRTSSPIKGLELLGDLAASFDILGRHRLSVDLEIAYLSELAGNYARARSKFRELHHRLTPFNPEDRTHLRSRINHADMLIMDGSFLEGSRLLLETAELIGPSSPAEWAEVVRYRGHAFRFSLIHERAEELYLRALDAARGIPALEAKLWTNLAESRCWLQPSLALEAVAVSMDLNARLGNQIELVKCQVARGIALARHKEFGASFANLEEAMSKATAIDYPAAVAFGLQAITMVNQWAGRTSEAGESLSKLRRQIEKIGTYRHLLLIPFHALPGGTVTDALVWQPDWIQPDSVPTALDLLIRPPT